MARLRVFLCACLGTCAVSLGQVDISSPPKDPQTVYVRDSAVATEKLALADKMERLKEWDKSADVYQEIAQKFADRVIASHTDDNGRPDQYVSAALVVQERIAKWPAEGLQVYRRRYEDTARDLLNGAPDDRAVWQKVLTEYFVTDAGRDAGLKLIADAFERGEFSAASGTGTRLLTLHPGLVADRPLVLFETALAEHLGGNDKAAKPWLDELQSRFPNATASIRGVDAKLGDTLAAELKNTPAMPTAYTSDNWPMAFGSPDAAAVPQTISAGGAKLFSIDLPTSTGRGNRNVKLYQQHTVRDREIGGMTGILPAIDDGQLFFQDNARIYAVDLASGLPLQEWLQTYPGDKRGIFSINAMPLPRGKQMSVSVRGDRLVAIMGQAMSVIDAMGGELSQPPQIVCLDRNNGKRNWSTTMPRLKLPDELTKLHDAMFYGTPIVTGDSVYVLVHANSGGQFEECYLLSLKLSDGTFQWASYVASTSAGNMMFGFDDSTRGTGATAQIAVADDRLYVLTNEGAMACLDANDGKTLWLDIYPRTEAFRGHMRSFIQGEQSTRPFAINPPIVSRGLVYVMPSDGPFILVYDANSGDTIAQLPRKLDDKYEPADMLLAEVNDRLVLGNRGTIFSVPWRTFDTHKSLLDNGGMYRSFTASDSNEADAIRGRPFVSEKYVLIPTADKLYRMTLNQFKFESVYPAEGKWDDDESPGNVLATPDNLIIAGPTRVTAYADLSVATAKLDAKIQQNPADVESYLRYAELLFAAGKPMDAIARIDQAIDQMGGAAKLGGGPMRDRLFEIIVSAAQKAQRADSPPADVLAKLFDRAKLAADTPQQQVQCRLTQAAYFHKTGDIPSELALDQQILADASFRAAPAADKNGASTAGAVASQAIDDLIQQHGQQIYAAYDTEAFNRLNAAKQAQITDPAALLAIADEFPASVHATEALALAGDRFEASHQPRLATQTLRRLLQRGVTDERKLVVLEALARNYLTVPNQLDTAIVRLNQAKEIAADAKLDRPIVLADGRTLKDETIAQAVATLQQYRNAAAQAALPHLGVLPTTDGGDSSHAPFNHVIELGTASDIVRQQDDITRNDRIVTATENGRIDAYDVATAKPCWPGVDFGETPIGCGYSGDTLVVVGTTRAIGIGTDGKVLWHMWLNTLPAVEVAATIDATDNTPDSQDDIDDNAAQNAVQLRLRRVMRNGQIRRLVMLNAAAPPVVAVPDDPPQGEQIVKYHVLSDRLLLGTSTGRIVSIDLTSGNTDWQARLQDVSVRHFLANEDFVAVSYTDGPSSDVYALDAISGQVVLHNAYSGNEGPTPTTLVNLALSPDGVLITMQGNRLLGRDLYDLSTKQWACNANPTNPMDNPFIASTDDNQLIIADDCVLAVYRSTSQLESVRPYDLRTLEPKQTHNTQLNRDIDTIYPSHMSTDRDGNGVQVVNSGVSIYIVGPHSLAAYNLNRPDSEWDSGGGSIDHGILREFVVARDYAVVINQLPNQNLGSPQLVAIEMALYNRAIAPSGVESGVLERRMPLRDPHGFMADQWQVVDGAFAYVSGDQKLKLLRANQ